MTALKIIGLMLGIAFTVFGYLIRFKKKYNLINGFESDLKNGLKTEEYAIRVGTVEFVVGIAVLVAAMALLIFD